MTRHTDSARDESTPDSEGPIDPDYVLLTNYLDDALTDDERAAFEARCDADVVFWDKVAPTLLLLALNLEPDADAAAYALGYEPVPVPQAVTELPKVQLATQPRERPVAAVLSTAELTRPVISTPAGAVPIPKASRGRRFAGGAMRATIWIVSIAAGLIMILSSPKLIPATAFVFRTLHLIRPGRGANSPIAIAYRNDQKHGWSGEEGVGTLIQDTTGPSQTRRIAVPIGLMVTLRPNSRLAYKHPDNASERALDIDNPVTVDGEVVLELGEHWRILTHTAVLELTAGEYAIRSLPFSTQTQINVGTGKAIIYPIGPNRDSLVAKEGDEVLVPKTGLSRITHDSTGFPLFGGDPPGPTEYTKPGGGVP